MLNPPTTEDDLSSVIDDSPVEQTPQPPTNTFVQNPNSFDDELSDSEENPNTNTNEDDEDSNDRRNATNSSANILPPLPPQAADLLQKSKAGLLTGWAALIANATAAAIVVNEAAAPHVATVNKQMEPVFESEGYKNFSTTVKDGASKTGEFLGKTGAVVKEHAIITGTVIKESSIKAGEAISVASKEGVENVKQMNIPEKANEGFLTARRATMEGIEKVGKFSNETFEKGRKKAEEVQKDGL